MDIKNIIFLLVGAGAGCAGTYIFMKDKFDKLIQEETDSVKKYYEEKYSNNNDDIPEKEPEVESEKKVVEERKKPDVAVEPDYDEIIEKLNYNQYSTKAGSSKLASRPYIISEAEWEDDNKYIKKTISYFEEDEVCFDNDNNDVYENVGKDIGNDNLEQLTEEGQDELYVRNEKLGIDFDIIFETGSYENFIENGDYE